jgi:hypothetical protein
MLSMVYACCYLRVVNSKYRWLSVYVFTLLYLLFHTWFLLVLLLCMEKGDGGKGGK